MKPCWAAAIPGCRGDGASRKKARSGSKGSDIPCFRFGLLFGAGLLRPKEDRYIVYDQQTSSSLAISLIPATCRSDSCAICFW